MHLLSNIIELPVTKSVVKESGLGKAIGSIDKHKICVDSPNAAAVTERVTKIKRAWNKSVKALNEQVLLFTKRKTFFYRCRHAFALTIIHFLTGGTGAKT